MVNQITSNFTVSFFFNEKKKPDSSNGISKLSVLDVCVFAGWHPDYSDEKTILEEISGSFRRLKNKKNL